MKQFLLMLAMMPLVSFAQDGYRPLVEQGKKWTYHHDTYQYVYDYHYTLEGDTVVAGKDCLKMYSENRYGDGERQYEGALFEENKKETTYELVRVDAVVSNPPYSQKWDPKDKEFDPRYKDFGIAPKAKADFAFLLHDLYHLEDDGIMTIVLPHGVLFRGGEEAKIRESLIEKNRIDAIIGLPENIFFGTNIATIIIISKSIHMASFTS